LLTFFEDCCMSWTKPNWFSFKFHSLKFLRQLWLLLRPPLISISPFFLLSPTNFAIASLLLDGSNSIITLVSPLTGIIILILYYFNLGFLFQHFQIQICYTNYFGFHHQFNLFRGHQVLY
jgi:hypothetical protein